MRELVRAQMWRLPGSDRVRRHPEQEQGEDNPSGSSCGRESAHSRRWETSLLIAPITEAETRYAMHVARRLRRGSGMNMELYAGVGDSLRSGLAFADRRGIPHVVLVGEDEDMRHTITIRCMADRRQITLLLSDVSREDVEHSVSSCQRERPSSR